MRRVLIIEDDAVQAGTLMKLFRTERIACAHSVTFEEGLERLKVEQFDCAVVDLCGMGPDLESFDVARRLPEIQEHCAVVAYTGSYDPDLIKEVRKTGAAFVNKPGYELLVEKVWSQIEYRSPGRDSEVGLQIAQQKISAKLTPAHWSVILACAALTLTIGGGLYHSVSDEARQATIMERRLDATENGLAEADKKGAARDAQISIIQQQNQASIDDRAALHAQAIQASEQQRDIKADIIRRMERIEDKIDHLRPSL